MTTPDDRPPRQVEPAHPALLEGAVVRQVLVLPFAAVISLRWQGEGLILVLAAGRMAQGLGLLAGDARGLAKTDLAGMVKATAAVEGARVARVSERGAELRAHDASWAVAIERAQRVFVRPGTLADGDAALPEDSRDALLARGKELLAGIAAESLERARETVIGSLDRACKRIARRIAAIGEDLARVSEAEALSAQAQWLVAEAARAPRGARSIAVTDWSSGEAKVIELPLDPARTAREQVEALFKKARRIKRGAAIASERRKQAQDRGDVLVRLLAEVHDSESHEALAAIVRRARAAAAGDFTHDAEAAARGSGTARAARPAQPRRKAYRTFRASTGARILVGRGGADNDELTVHVARPHDLWLHARGQPGAHVVVPLDKGHSCPPEVLVDAAHLAAHFSDARGELVVEIEHTDRRFVRKPRGSAAGLVLVQREKVLTLRVDPDRVAALVATETDGSIDA